MISFKELIHKSRIEEIPSEHIINLEVLLVKMNRIRLIYGEKMFVSSGYRTKERHQKIYAQINRKREAKKLPPLAVPRYSRHLKGQACDVLDPNGELKKWCEENEDLLREVGLFLELGTVGWMHFQSVPYGSYAPGDSIWFKPY